MYVCVDLCFVCLVQLSPMPRERCESCKNWCNRRFKCEVGGEMRCKQCQRDNIHNHNQSSPSTSLKQQEQQPIFEKSSEHHRISIPQRYSIITLHLLNYTNENIASIINCHVKSVRRWIHHFETTGDFTEEAVQDLQREGNTLTSLTHTLTYSLIHSYVCVVR